MRATDNTTEPQAAKGSTSTGKKSAKERTVYEPNEAVYQLYINDMD